VFGSSVPQVALPVLRNTIILYDYFFLSSWYLEIMWGLCCSPSKWCFHLIKGSTYVASPGMHFKVWVKVEDVSVIGERTVENSRNQNRCYLALATFWDQFQNEVSPKIFYFLLDKPSRSSPSRYKQQTIDQSHVADHSWNVWAWLLLFSNIAMPERWFHWDYAKLNYSITLWEELMPIENW